MRVMNYLLETGPRLRVTKPMCFTRAQTLVLVVHSMDRMAIETKTCGKSKTSNLEGYSEKGVLKH